MKSKKYIIAWLLTICHWAYSQQQYRMDVETQDGLVTSFLMSRVQDMTYNADHTFINLRGRNTFTQKIYRNADIASITWTEYNASPAGDGAGEFLLDEKHLEIVTPQYAIRFDAPAIDTDVKLTVTKRTGLPSPFEEGVTNMVAYDFDLEDVHELDGMVEIRLPIRISPKGIPIAAYYNEATGEWEPVNYRYNKATGEIVIKTSHLSTYAGFEVPEELTRLAKLTYMCLVEPANPVHEIMKAMTKLAYSDHPDAEAIETFGGEYSDISQLGLDFGFNALQSLGFGSEMLEDFSGVLGNLGTALSVWQICRDDYHDNKVQLGGNALKFVMTQLIGTMSNLCSSAIMKASMASVAIIDYSINKFATTAWSGRKDLYKSAYELYYSRGERGYRTAKQWYQELLPFFKRTDLNEEQVNALVENCVQRYINEFWNDEDIQSEYFTKAHDRFGFSYGGGLNKSIMDELSNELRGNLYNGVLVSVILAIKNKIEDDAYDLAESNMKKYVSEMNKGVMLSFSDSGLEDGKSKYAGCTVRFKELPSSIKDPEQWQCTLSDKGTGNIQYRIFPMADAEMKPEMEVVTDKDEVVLEFTLKGLRAGYTRETAENFIDLNDVDAETDIQEDVYSIVMNPTYVHLPLTVTGQVDEEEIIEVMEPSETDGIYYETWYQDMVDAFKALEDVEPDIEGNISYSKDGLQLTGSIDPQTKHGSGTFTLKTSYHNEILTVEQVKTLFSSLDNWMDYRQKTNLVNNLLMNGDMEHEVMGTFTVRKSGDKTKFAFTGKGTYKLSATAFNEVRNPKLVQTYLGDIEVTTTQVEQDGTVEIDVKLVR